MSAARTVASISALALLTACASNIHLGIERWRSYLEERGPYSTWAQCIRDRSYHYHDPEGTGVVVTNAGTFTQVLADCREHMVGPGWDHLTEREMRQLLADAYQAFRQAGADLMARYEASVI